MKMAVKYRPGPNLVFLEALITYSVDIMSNAKHTMFARNIAVYNK